MAHWLEFFRLESLRSFNGLRRDWPSILLAVLSLGVATAISTSIFSLYDAVQLRDLPISASDRVYVLTLSGPAGMKGGLCLADLGETKTIPGVEAAALAEYPSAYTVGGGDLNVNGVMASSGYFQTLGVNLEAGRPPINDEEPGMVISHRLWTQVGSPILENAHLAVDKVPVPIVGVAKPDFHGIHGGKSISIWMTPKSYSAFTVLGDDVLHGRGLRNSIAYLRIKSGQNLALVRNHLRQLATQWAAIDPVGHGGTVLKSRMPEAQGNSAFSPNLMVINASRDGAFRGAIPFSSALILVSVAMLALALSNIATLHYARSIEQRRDLAIRRALGAGVMADIGKVVAEGLQISLPAALIGLSCGLPGGRILGDLAGLGPLRPVLDGRVLCFTLVLPFAVSLASSAIALMLASRRDLLRDLASTGIDLHGRRAQTMLMVGQVGLSMVLVSLSAIWALGVRDISKRDLGYDSRNLVAIRFNIPFVDGTPLAKLRERAVQSQQELLSRISQVPGVRSLGQGWPGPMEYQNSTRLDDGMEVGETFVSPGWFKTIGARMLRGRDFGSSDPVGDRSLVIVSQTLAKRKWPKGDAVGKVIWANRHPMSVVGVVSDIQMDTPDSDMRPWIFILGAPIQQTIAMKIDHGGVAAINTARSIIRSVEPKARIQVESQEDLLNEFLMPRRVTVFLLSVSGMVALLIMAAGAYSIQCLVVASQTRELGIRMALGATPGMILVGIMRGNAKRIGFGVLLGGAMSATFLLVLRSQILGLPPLWIMVWLCAGMGAVVLVVAGLASLIPARKAVSVDPMQAIRQP